MMPPTHRPTGRVPRPEQKREADIRRGSARARGYDSRWDKAAATHKRSHPTCEYCEAGVFGPVRVVGADCTDHLYPHRTYDGVFWVTDWWVSSCDDCHDGPKQALERKGKAGLDALAIRMGRPVLDDLTLRPGRT